MKKICYQTLMETERAGERTLRAVELRCPDSALEANLAIARAEAHNGEVAVEAFGEDTPAAPSPQEDMDAMLVDHELRLTLLELGIADDAAL